MESREHALYGYFSTIPTGEEQEDFADILDRSKYELPYHNAAFTPEMPGRPAATHPNKIGGRMSRTLKDNGGQNRTQKGLSMPPYYHAPNMCTALGDSGVNCTELGIIPHGMPFHKKMQPHAGTWDGLMR